MQVTPIEQVRKSIFGSLKYERNERGMTQKQLADAIGRSQSTVNGWEGSNGSIGLDDAWQVADVYGISLDQLAGRAPRTAVA